MSSDAKVAKLLARWIEMDGKPMTYRTLSRELSVHVTEAQRLLEAYANAHPALEAVYLVSGVPAAASADGDAMDVDGAAEDKVSVRTMALVKRAQVDARKATFGPSTVASHIYSLSPAPLPSAAALMAPFTALLSHCAYLAPQTYGTSQNAEIHMLKGAEARLKAGAVAERKAADKATAADKERARKEAEKGKGGEADKGAGKKIGALDWSKAKEKPKPAPPATKRSPSPKRSASASTSKRVALSDSESDGAPSAPPPKSVARPAAVVEKKPKAAPPAPVAVSKEEREKIERQKKELEGLWDAEEDDSSVSKAKGKRKATSFSDDDDIQETAAPASPPKKAAPAPRKKPAPKPKAEKAEEVVRNAEGKIRRTRRIVKSETVLNAKGYMVTEDVSEVESYYTDDESPPAALSKKPAAPSRASSTSSTTTATAAGGADGKRKPAPAKASKPVAKGQGNLKSFFTKK